VQLADPRDSTNKPAIPVRSVTGRTHLERRVVCMQANSADNLPSGAAAGALLPRNFLKGTRVEGTIFSGSSSVVAAATSIAGPMQSFTLLL